MKLPSHFGPVASAFLFAGCLVSIGAAQTAATLPEATADFLDRHCSSCHNDVDKEGGLDLTSVKYVPADPANFQLWVKVHDRVQANEMPPKEKKRPAAAELSSFVRDLEKTLITSEKASLAQEGRSTRRRLNRAEYESALRDLLNAPWLQVKEQLPEDGEAFKFNKVSTALDVSYVHMTRYMSAADYALRQAMAVKLVQPPTTTKRYYARDEDSGLNTFTPSFGNPGPDRHKFPVLGTEAQPEVRRRNAPLTAGEENPAVRDQEATGWISSNYVTGFGSRWTSFRAPVTGRYRLRFSGYTLWVGPGGQGHSYKNGNDKNPQLTAPLWFRPNYDDISAGRRYEPITIYSNGGASNRLLGKFDVFPDPSVQQLDDVWLLGNEYLVTDSSRFYRSRPTGFKGGFTNPLAQRDGMPAVAFRWMEIEGPFYDESTTAGYKLMFGDLALKKIEPGQPGVQVEAVSPGGGGGRGRGRGQQGGGAGFGAQAGLPPNTALVDVVSENQEQDSERLLRAFMAKAYRRPPQEKEVQRFLALIKQRRDAGLGFAQSQVAGYTAVLASPDFVFVDEQAGRLDDYALATRLALFLWNSRPDDALRAKATSGELHKPAVLRAETERMLNDPKSSRFVDSFLDYWLDIRRMDETTPSTTLYNDYYLDDSLTEAALDETQMFFTELLQKDLPARNIVDSNFTYLNDRLAVHYGIPNVEGAKMRRVSLPPGSVRGGFMTQASVLKVTANGTTTSPVIRGKWIMERIVGFEIPPPPAAVPAVEPDIRGAVTIRDQLDKHRADESCAACHRKIDPPGFALEAFDVMGGWRDRYRGSSPDKAPIEGFGKNGWPYVFHFALPVDSSGKMADGRAFSDVREFKKLLLQDETQLARNLARQLSVYATGSPVRFSDRAAIAQIVEKTKARQFGVRSLVHEIVESDLFLNK